MKVNKIQLTQNHLESCFFSVRFKISKTFWGLNPPITKFYLECLLCLWSGQFSLWNLNRKILMSLHSIVWHRNPPFLAQISEAETQSQAQILLKNIFQLKKNVFKGNVSLPASCTSSCVGAVSIQQFSATPRSDWKAFYRFSLVFMRIKMTKKHEKDQNLEQLCSYLCTWIQKRKKGKK